MENELDTMAALIESGFDVRLATAFECALDHWNYITDKTTEPTESTERAAHRATRRAKLHELGKALAEALVDFVGKDVDCTYLHHFTYDFPILATRVGSILRVSMEGFEHANKVTKAIFNNQTSRGGKMGANGLRRHEYLQALEHRREGTMVSNNLGLTNSTSAARIYTKPAELYNRFYDVRAALAELAAVKVELEARAQGPECAPCEPEKGQVPAGARDPMWNVNVIIYHV